MIFMAFEEYLSAGMHIGTKQQTEKMKKFVYKTRDDGLAVLDLQTMDLRMKTAANFLSKFERIVVVSRKSIAFKAVKKFAEVTNAKSITGRFLPGIITNPSFREYHEPDVLIVTDPSVDGQAVKEAIRMRVPIVALCDTINEINGIDYIIPVNNKGRKAIAMTYFILAKEILKARGIIKEDSEFKVTIEEFEAEQKEERQ
jgi:small subunit ribosomal protein S2